MPEPPIDWEQVARSALAANHAKGSHRLTRHILVALCTELASGIPLETAARLHRLDPQDVRDWRTRYPRAGQAVERARAVGEALYIKRIAEARPWQAQAHLLALAQPGYREDGAATGAGGPQINVTINVPIPQLVGVGQRPMVDVTPQRTPQEVVPDRIGDISDQPK